jgi:hypothetical protein
LIKKVPNFTLWQQSGIFFVKIPETKFSTNFEPISASNTPIDPARQAKTQNFKNFPDFILGKQLVIFVDITPLNNFSNVDRFSQIY